MKIDREAIDPYQFEDGCIAAARTFGRKGEVQVRFTGERAFTDGNSITIPAIDKNKPIDRPTAMIARGYVDHEAGHIRHSEIEVYQKAVELAVKAGDKLFPAVLNAIEDVRIEDCVTGEYPGAQKNLEAVQQAIIEEGIKQLKANPSAAADWKQIVPIAITVAGFERAGYDCPAQAQFLAMLPKEIREQVELWVDAVSGLPRIVEREEGGEWVRNGKPGTAEAVKLAQLVCQEAHAQAKANPPPQPGPGNGPPGPAGDVPQTSKPSPGAGTPGDVPGAPGGSGEGKEKAAGNQPAPPGAGAAEGTAKPGAGAASPKVETEYASEAPTGKTEEGGAGAGGGSGADGTLSSAKNASYEAWIKAGKEPIANTLNAEHVFARMSGDRRTSYRAYSTAQDKVHHRTDPAGKYGESTRGLLMNLPENAVTYREVLTGASGKVSVMSRKLTRALMDKQRRGWLRGTESGSFDNHRLIAAVLGKPAVFRQRDDAPEFNTAVMVVVDMSGSMNGREHREGQRKIVLAQQAAICMAEALDRVNVPYAVTGFHNTTGFDEKAQDECNEAFTRGERYSRITPLDLYVFKNFDEALRQAQRPLGAMAALVGGDNADGECVMQAYRLLAKRTERKKVMLVLSDGRPATTSHYEAHLHSNLRNTIAYIEQRGVKLVGIGIMSTDVKLYYPKWALLNSLDDLPKTVFDQVSRMILGERFVVDNADLMAGQASAAARR